MEKKVKFFEKPGTAKIVYSVIIALLCITAIIVGIVAANNRGNEDVPPIVDGGDVNEGNDNEGGENDGSTVEPPNEETPPEKLTFIAPCVGSVVKSHSLTNPVYSETLEEWRVHTGIDISCQEGASVYAASRGEVSRVYTHPLHGFTVEISHEEGFKTVYSNLDPKAQGTVKVGDKVESGTKIGTVGDSSVSELAEEPHLHFEFLLDGKRVDPLEYISEEAKRSSLGMDISTES